MLYKAPFYYDALYCMCKCVVVIGDLEKLFSVVCISPQSSLSQMKQQANLFALWPSSKCNEGVSVSELDNPGFSATADPELELESPPVAETGTNPQLEGNAILPCQSACCADLRVANQPFDKAFLATTKQQVGNKEEYCYLNPQWYRDYKWLHFCQSSMKLFCFYCLLAHHANPNLASSTQHCEITFIKEGYQNWKKDTDRFKNHQLSELHRNAVFKYESSKQPTITQQISTPASKEMQKNREMLLKVLSSLRFLLKQGLPIRGHTNEVGNLYQLLTLRSEDCPPLSSWLQNQQYMSPVIINEMIKLMGNELLRQLLVRIRESTWFAILADETADIANHEQPSCSIRWVTKDYDIHEDFIGLVYVPRITSEVITSAIKDILIRCNLPLTLCRGQGYDGAANMMGHLNGVAKQIQEVEYTAIVVHCFAHCLNLSLQDVSKKTNTVRQALDLVWEISRLVHTTHPNEHSYLNSANKIWPFLVPAYDHCVLPDGQ